MQATAPNGAAIIKTARIPSAKACFNAFTPAPIIMGVTHGICGRAVALSEAKAPTKAGTDVIGSPARTAASAT